MSFSSDCKEELCRVPCDKSCCRLSELAALYMTLGTLSLLGRGQLCVQFSMESPAIARRVFVLLQKETQIVAQLHYVTHARFGGRRKCVLTVGPHQAPALLGTLGMMETDAEGATALRSTVPRVKLNRDCCRRAFLRGALLGCGTISNPEHGYHLELAAADETLRLNIAKCLQSIGVPIKQTQRGGAVSLYCKQSDHIADILTAAGAHQAVTKLESIRVRRQVLGTVNRAMNCDNANLQKQMDASQRQLELIARLMETERFGAMSPALQQIARARMQAPDMSLEELGQTLDPPIGKSGVNHRIRRLIHFAQEELYEPNAAVEPPPEKQK
ncbi:MAG: DNA-binding protein WhiA [Eubacteriales bacterium]|nr:DNA-binding protein WhiA [Eubacteriales bacterium]MDD3214620.1 DNA-binding protein WhiA [Eubacteriales bacterium]